MLLLCYCHVLCESQMSFHFFLYRISQLGLFRSTKPAYCVGSDAFFFAVRQLLLVLLLFFRHLFHFGPEMVLEVSVGLARLPV